MREMCACCGADHDAPHDLHPMCSRRCKASDCHRFHAVIAMKRTAAKRGERDLNQLSINVALDVGHSEKLVAASVPTERISTLNQIPVDRERSGFGRGEIEPVAPPA